MEEVTILYYYRKRPIILWKFSYGFVPNWYYIYKYVKDISNLDHVFQDNLCAGFRKKSSNINKSIALIKHHYACPRPFEYTLSWNINIKIL